MTDIDAVALDQSAIREPETLKALRERVKVATGADRHLDVDLFRFLKEPFGAIPAYTASIDAAVALVERVLPGWWWYLSVNGSGFTGIVAEPESDGKWQHAPTPELALLGGLLTALISRQETTHDD